MPVTVILPAVPVRHRISIIIFHHRSIIDRQRMRVPAGEK